MADANDYIQIFVHVCRTAQAEIQAVFVNHWGSELDRSRLYTSLVWESTVLLALCSEDTKIVITKLTIILLKPKCVLI